ncbi:MAG: hypothetical protein QUV02_09140 [Maricaulis sp.]|uniref:hypothetical protein n=1 Tax=Maricaulis sp. TaxID=1486257 RepID=UPI00261E23DB|nr:hypothetical protein [Maricaulis sp.]MDM7984605.1 hypothetical protein [Maricaulis sp.]
MSSRAFLLSCPFPSGIPADDLPQAGSWCMKWNVPLFWYAGFSSAGRVNLHHSEIGLEFPTFHATPEALAENLASSRDVMLDLLPSELRDDYAGLYDAFAARVKSDFQDGALFEIADFFALAEFDPSALEAFPGEIQKLDDARNGQHTLTLDDFLFAGAFDVGGEPAPADDCTAVELATRWRLILTGGPVDDQSWPPEPSPTEIDLAEQMIAKARPQRPRAMEPASSAPVSSNEKPWWKFW